MRGFSPSERAHETLLHLLFTRFALFTKMQKRENHHASNTTSFTWNGSLKKPFSHNLLVLF